MLDSKIVYDSYIQPFKLVEELGLNCGYEKSFKLSPGHLLPNRYLLGVDTKQLDQNKLAIIFRQMQMPSPFVGDFDARLTGANLVLLGFEEGVDDCIYKIYLEYWDKIKDRLEASQPPYRSETLFIGYKWSALDNSRSVVTHYIYYPRLGLEQIGERLQVLVPAAEGAITCEIARQVVELCAKHADSERFIFLEAGEAGNQRKSFDINLYRAEVRMEVIYPVLKQLCRHYSVRVTELDRIYQDFRHRELGHISGGIDRHGKPFFTVYYDNQPDNGV